MSDAYTGIVIGAAAGLVTVIITGLWGWLVRSWQRREQTAYIRDLVMDSMKRIQSAAPPPQQPISADSIRYLLFCDLRDSLRVALSYRATRLTYQETSFLQRILVKIESMCTDLGVSAINSMPLRAADKFSKDLQELKWLGLPTKPFP